MPAEFPVKRIIIVGGGTAGWMSALILAHTLRQHPCEITLLESAEVGVIGVGEGSTPILKKFFDTLGIAESEWMPECNASFKTGIRFVGWSGRAEYASYFHPFASPLDQYTMPTLVHQLESRLQGQSAHTLPDDYFLSACLAANNLAPLPAEQFPFYPTYGYHFDAVLLGRFLKRKAQSRGIRHTMCHISRVIQNESGEIKALQTDQGELMSADLYVDCSGFQGILIDKALKTPFLSYREHLLNDAAIALPGPSQEVIRPQTTATALKFGWAWHIPLQNRVGNGYVYSSRYTDQQQAEFELRQHLGLLDADLSARHLTMKVGRVAQHWHKNCLAVGLSQGFLEPLEATALYLMQMTLGIFSLFLERGDLSPSAQQAFNQEINDYFDGHRNYIIAHYKTTARNDTAYWHDNARGLATIPDSLKRLFEVWISGQDIQEELQRQHIARFYPASSWYALLAGMGLFPAQDSLLPTDPRVNETREFLRRCCLNFPTHQQALSSLAQHSKMLA